MSAKSYIKQLLLEVILGIGQTAAARGSTWQQLNFQVMYRLDRFLHERNIIHQAATVGSHPGHRTNCCSAWQHLAATQFSGDVPTRSFFARAQHHTSSSYCWKSSWASDKLLQRVAALGSNSIFR